MQIRNALDIIGGNALLFHLLAVIRHVFPNMLYLFDQALVLPGKDLFP